MDIKTIKKYCVDYKGKSFTEIAGIIKKETGSELSLRTLRRLVSDGYKTMKSTNTLAPNELNYKGEKSITSLEEAISFFRIDTEIYDVKKFTVNSWDVAGKNGKRTNYQVKVFLEPKEVKVNFEELKQQVKSSIKKIKVKKTKGGKRVAVLALSDFHIGAKVEAMDTTPDFSYKVIIQKLAEIKEQVNQMNYDEVHIAMLGDFIETFTGLNHPNSWKGIEQGGYGAEVVITAYKILSTFLEGIKNLSKVYMVAGNHDRVTSSSKEDVKGDAAKLIHFMLEKSMSIEVKYSPLILAEDIDGIRYILSHNHHSISKNVTKVCFEFGRNDSYNVVLGGHWHQRKTSSFYEQKETYIDQMNYRALVVAPLFTGNFYSESNGWNTNAGYTLIENNGKNKVNVFDYTI